MQAAMRTDISIADRVGNGLVAGFIATLVVSGLHEPVTVLTTAVGVRAPVTGLLFHFFVGTLMWGSVFGLVHDYLFGPSWLRGILFSVGAALLVMFAIAPLTGSGFLCLRLGAFAPFVVVLFHLAYGAILGAIYGKLIDTDEAREHLAHHAHR